MITQILAKVLPVLVMIALGRVCATKGILSDEQHAGLKNIIGDILLPVVLFQAFFTADYGTRMLLVFVLVFSAVTLVLGQMDLSAIAYDSGSSAILGPVAAGVISGAIYGWVIRQNGSTGGTDIVAAWVRKKHPEASLVWLIFSLNAAVAVLSFFVYG